ncbi:MAG TPA: RNA-binding cell elongation regulator Jag/EloR [Euzebyales bacterium]|nr:RNA-binding cell elongation regulator Jag/EloR [Euzebyales bacterium]
MVEKRASTVEDATTAALAELGVGRDAVKVEVLSEGRRGLFSGRSRAHVRVTVLDAAANNGETTVTETAVQDADASVEDTTERAVAKAADAPAHEEPVVTTDDEPVVTTDEPPTVTTDEADDADADATNRLAELNEEADLAADFVEGLLDILELPGDIEIEVDESQAFVNVVDVGSGLLIGRRGATLEALQELVRAATQRQIERRSHVRIDIEGYRQRQLEKMKDRCRDGIAQVRETGEPFRLEPMDAYERKIMHDLVARTGGVTSASEGTEPRRRVVVYAEEE